MTFIRQSKNRRSIFRRLLIPGILGGLLCLFHGGLFEESVNTADRGFFTNVACAQGSPTISKDARTDTKTSPASIELSELAKEQDPFLLERTPLDAIILYDQAGKQSVVLPGGWPLEVFDEFSKFLLKDRQEPIPPYIIQGIAAKGRVVSGHSTDQRTTGARVEVEIRFQLTTTGSRAVRIPLGMKEGILLYPDDSLKETEKEATDTKRSLPYHYSGPGSFELTVDRETGEYIALIRPVSAQAASGEKSSPEASASTDNKNSSESEKERPTLTEAIEINAIPINSATASAADSGDSASNELRHELTLSLRFPLVRLGDEEQRLRISFPPSVSSQFVLTVPLEEAVATVTQGALLDSFQPPDGGSTRFSILGLKSDFDISWRKKRVEPIEDRPILYVEKASIIVRMESKSTLFDATLPIHSPTGSFDKVRIRLPQGSVFDQEGTETFTSGGNYSLRLLPEEERGIWGPPSNNESEPPPVVEVQFPRKTSGPVEVRIKAVQQFGTEKPGSWRNLTGFEVIGAERQHGFLSIGIPTDMKPKWNPIRGIRRIDLPHGIAPEGIDARFEFFSQPFSLRGQIVSPQTRINVKPEYQIVLNKGNATMTANFSFVVHGSKAEKLAVRLFDWQWTGDIKPTNLVDLESVDQDPSGLLTIPLRAPTDGAFEIELKAHRVLPAEDDPSRRHLTVRLPQPVADWIDPATFVVVPADNIEVLPVMSESKTVASDVDSEKSEDVPEKIEPASKEETPRTVGLTRRGRRSLPLRIELPIRQQDPLIYVTESNDAIFVADILSHEQEIKAEIQTNVRLFDSKEQITQIISYDVAYEPVHRLFLNVPGSLDEGERLRVMLDGKQLELRDVASLSETGLSDTGTRKRITLPEAMIGKFQLIVYYSVPPIHVEAGMTTPTTFSFVRPVDIPEVPHQVDMIVPQGFHVELYRETNRAWKASDPNARGVTGRTVSETGFTTTQPTDRLSLLVSVADRDALGTTVVERAWLQTWLNDSIRWDHGVYRISSERDAVSLWLPSTVGKDRKIVVHRDRVPVPVKLSPKGELTVPLTDDQKRRPFFLEVWYQIPADASGRMELPHFSDETLVRCKYWQIILPQNRHIIDVPSGWAPEYQWSRIGLFWGRVPSVRMEEIGLYPETTEEVPISSEANQYLFSSLNPPDQSSLMIVDRSVIVLFASSISLLIGLILIYFPQTRYAGALLGLGIALIAMVSYQPTPVLLMLQASSLGVLIALGAGYVYRIVYRDEQWIVPASPDWSEDTTPSEVYSVIMDEESKQTREKNSGEKTGAEK